MVAGSPRPDRGPRGLHGHRGAAAGHGALARQTPGGLPPPAGGRHSAGGSRVGVGQLPRAVTCLLSRTSRRYWAPQTEPLVGGNCSSVTRTMGNLSPSRIWSRRRISSTLLQVEEMK